MDLGAFSVSLSVKDLSASRAFYEALGFSVIGGEAEQNWLILKNGAATVGLFQGMFDGNMLTFNPKWDQSAQPSDGPDIRDIQTALKDAGISLDTEVDPATSGPGSLMVRDPDGNVIFLDQHV